MSLREISDTVEQRQVLSILEQEFCPVYPD